MALLIIALFLTAWIGFPRAAGNASFTLSPSSGSYDKNTNFALTVYENSGSEQVNAVDAKLVYDQSKLQFVGVSTSGSPFDFCTEKTGGSGTVSIVCAKLGGSVSGQQQVGKVTFKARVGSGTTSVSFGGNSHIVRSADSEDIWNGNTSGGTYNLKSSSTGGGSSGGSSSGGTSDSISDAGSPKPSNSSNGTDQPDSSNGDSGGSEDSETSEVAASQNSAGSGSPTAGSGDGAEAAAGAAESAMTKPTLAIILALLAGLAIIVLAIRAIKLRASSNALFKATPEKTSDIHDMHLPNYANTPKPGNVYSPGGSGVPTNQAKPNAT